MAYQVPIDRAGAVPLRRDPAACVMLTGDAAIPVAIRGVTGAGAEADTAARPAIGDRVSLRHPRGGTIAATVAGHRGSGLTLAFARDERAVGFALAVTIGAAT